jgi:hypothetical protein
MYALIRRAKEKKKQGKADDSKAKKRCHHQTDSPQVVSSNGKTEGTRETELTEGKCKSCKLEKKAARVYRWKLIAGLLFPFALQALDVTM